MAYYNIFCKPSTGEEKSHSGRRIKGIQRQRIQAGVHEQHCKRRADRQRNAVLLL